MSTDPIESALALVNAQPAPVAPALDMDAEIKRLAELTPLDYERERVEAAKSFGVRTSALDAEVRKARSDASDPTEDPFDDVEPWLERVSGADLLDEIQSVILRFSVLPEHSAPLIAAWVLHAWAHDAADISPVLAVISPEKRCGKTTLLSTVSALVPRPLNAVNISASVLFRVIEKFGPTVLIDEADTFLTAETNSDIRGMLNGGHNRLSAYVWRSVGDDHEPKRFRVWAPKAVAMIGKLPDTLEDRALVVHLRRKYTGEQVERFRFDRLQEFLPLRRKAARWSADHTISLRGADPHVPAELHDRAQDNARTICAIADLAGGKWPRLIRDALVGAASQVDDEPQSKGVLLLRDIDKVLAGRRLEDHAEPDRLGSTDLVTKLCALPESPWLEWRNGKPISSQGVAALLRGYRVKPVQDRHGSYYRPSDFVEALKRYLPRTSETTATIATTATESKTATEKPSDFNLGGSCGSHGSSSEGIAQNCHQGSSNWSDEQISTAIDGAWETFRRQNDSNDPKAWA